MLDFLKPCVGAAYATHRGDEIEVIGFGTRGIAIQYADGRTELMDSQRWSSHITHQLSEQLETLI